MRFLHCSDLHITQDYTSLRWQELGWRRTLALLELGVGGRAKAYRNAPVTVRQIIVEMASHRADHLLVSGDLTAYATELEFLEARNALGPIANVREACSLVPGNHDCFTPNAVKSSRFERHFAHLLESDLPEYCREGPYPFVHLKGDGAAVVGLLSARVMAVPGLAYGLIGAAQLSGLDDLLDDQRMRHRAVLVLVHHGPISKNGRRDSRIHGLRDADALLARLHGPRFAVLYGHLHDRFHHACSPTRPHLFCAGSSTQSGREGYWVIDVRDGEIADFSMHVPRLTFPR